MLEEANIVIKETSNLLNCGGFDLRQWHTNDSEILSDIDINLSTEMVQGIDKTGVKILGVLWITVEDILRHIN